MFIFIGSAKVIPENRLYKITTNGKNIYIEYDGGEIVYPNADSEQGMPKIEVAKISYPDEESVLWEMRKFYLACDKKAGVYCFSPDKGVELS